MDSNDAIFYTSLYTFLGGFVIAISGMILKSKCKTVKLCGICEIERDIEAEIQEHSLEIQQRHHTHPSLDRPIP